LFATFTFAALLQGIAIVTRFAVLAAMTHCVVEAAQTFSGCAVAGVAILWVDIVVARTHLTVNLWQR